MKLGSSIKNGLTHKKRTSQGHKNVTKTSMNKHKARSYKKYRGQGK